MDEVGQGRPGPFCTIEDANVAFRAGRVLDRAPARDADDGAWTKRDVAVLARIHTIEAANAAFRVPASPATTAATSPAADTLDN